MKTTHTIEIAAPPERVFDWLDDADRLMQWVPNLVVSEDLEVTPEKVGSTFRQVYEEHGRRMEMLGMVAEYEPNRRLVCDIVGDTFDLTVGYTLDDAHGKTRLTQDTEVRFKGFAVKLIIGLLSPTIRKSSMKQLAQGFAKLKELCEAETPHDT